MEQLPHPVPSPPPCSAVFVGRKSASTTEGLSGYSKAKGEGAGG